MSAQHSLSWPVTGKTRSACIRGPATPARGTARSAARCCGHVRSHGRAARASIRPWPPRRLGEQLQPRFETLEEETGGSYFYHLSVADGVKAGGYPGWTQDPLWPECPGCGMEMEHLLTISSAEFDGASWRTWLPVEDTLAAGTIWDLPDQERKAIKSAHGLMLGDMGGIYLF